ncbi:spore coat U domain-containing protein [uncultured Sphingomonas sp.]|uniref:Csu type fimbrial protein n=1 Tax=uncultured Sphingomonas sp. TaxID=158754 RepID=UPI0025F0B790|nr:spore coat U domain-containing protein [uncultured Sphingomonas sp.]
MTGLLRVARVLARLAAASVALFIGVAHAETQLSFQVSAAIVKGCVVAASGASQLGRIDFGTVAGTTTGTLDAAMVSGGTGGIAIECTPDTDVTVTADMGENASGGTRRMKLSGGTGFVAYQLFADGGSTAWTTQALAYRFATGATRRTLPIVGRAQLTGAMAAGSYADTVRVTIAW